jgi:hypothetical protein
MTFITTLLSHPNLKIQVISRLKRFSTGLDNSTSELLPEIAVTRKKSHVIIVNET